MGRWAREGKGDGRKWQGGGETAGLRTEAVGGAHPRPQLCRPPPHVRALGRLRMLLARLANLRVDSDSAAQAEEGAGQGARWARAAAGAAACSAQGRRATLLRLPGDAAL